MWPNPQGTKGWHTKQQQISNIKAKNHCLQYASVVGELGN